MPRHGDSGYNITDILEGMREEYWQGLAEADAPPEEMLECVIFKLGGELFSCETTHASEVIRVPKLVKLPRVEGIFTGAFNLRGEVMLAVDIRPLLSLPTPALTKNARILVIKSPNFKTGLLTEEVNEVAELSYTGFSPVSEEAHACRSNLVRGQFNTDAGALNLLDIPYLLNSPEMILNQGRLDKMKIPTTS